MTLGEIVSVLKEPTGWSSTTIRTLIIRLSEKDAVEIDRSAGIYRYTPKASRSECISAEVEAFVKRVFDDSTFDLMALLTREGTLTADEKGALVEMLQENAV